MSDKRPDCQGTPKAEPTCMCLCAWCVNAVKGCCRARAPWQCPVDHCSDYVERPEGPR